MERELLVEKLGQIEKAVGSDNIIQQLACVFFNEDSAVTYNDIIGMKTKLDVPIEGGLPLATLLALLRSSSVKEVEFGEAQDQLELKAGRSSYKLPFYNSDSALFEFPKPDETWTKVVIGSSKFTNALQKALISTGRDIGTGFRSGVTLSFEEEVVWIYSTDNVTMSRAATDLKLPKKLQNQEIIIPTQFAETLSGIGAKELLFSPDKGMVIAEGKGAQLFTRGSTQADSGKFEKVVETWLPEDVEFKPIPIELEPALNRAQLLSEDKMDITVEEGTLRLQTHSHAGAIDDVVDFEDTGVLGAQTIEVDPNLLLRGLDLADSMWFNDRVVAFEGDDFLYLVSAFTSRE